MGKHDPPLYRAAKAMTDYRLLRNQRGQKPLDAMQLFTSEDPEGSYGLDHELSGTRVKLNLSVEEFEDLVRDLREHHEAERDLKQLVAVLEKSNGLIADVKCRVERMAEKSRP